MSSNSEIRNLHQQRARDLVVVRPLPVSAPLAHIALALATDLLEARLPVITV